MEIQRFDLNPEVLVSGKASKTEDQGFGDMIKNGIQELNHKMLESKELAESFAAGEDVELHDVMIAGQEADIALRLATQLRSQAMQAYQEIIRMPI